MVQNNKIKFLTEFVPLLLFFITFKYTDLNTATLFLIIATIVSNIYAYIVTKELSYISIITLIIIVISGGLTILSGDTKYIKMKPTIISLSFASILIFGVISKRGFLKYILSESLDLTEHAWKILSLRWGMFFLLLALLNEIVWRNYSENFWVNYKIFGTIILTTLFTLSQISFIKKNKK